MWTSSFPNAICEFCDKRTEPKTSHFVISKYILKLKYSKEYGIGKKKIILRVS